MIAIIKRYSMALVFLALIIILMVLVTWGVTLFGENMLEDTGVQMHPRGEELNR